MALFQNSVLRGHLSKLDLTQVDEAYSRYEQYFVSKIENIKRSKEEQYQYGFLEDIFVKTLGYTLNPTTNYNLTTEFKNQTDSKKADGAILRDGKVIAVIELKSTKTKSMDSIVQQAFNYKNNHPTCRYIITSNFAKLRLYIDHSDSFEEFDLFEMDKERFKLFYYLLNRESIFSDLALRLKDESKLKDEQISNELYKKYSGLRSNLFENIIKNNPEIDKLTLLSKTQTLLDRMVFIFFAEDRGILPTNTIATIIDHYKNDIEDRELYHFYKIYFDAINRGNPKIDITEYNGGLFAKDEILDSLKIDDDVLNSCPLALSAYDFNTDIDVNILGHIFENSLSDIEEIKAKIAGEGFDKSKTKRKKDGVFYTPEYITKYIVDNTLGKLCQTKKIELDLENIEINIPKNPKKLNKSETKIKASLELYREYLLDLKIVDPACGSGAFLNQALNFLLDEHQFIDDGIKTLMGGNVLGLYDVKKGILENNLYGVDINSEAVEIAKLSLWLRTVEHGRKLNILSQKIKVGNSLIDDKSVADDAFVWEEEFAEVFEQGGFDCVIGNPPYGAKLSKTDKDFFYGKFKTVEYQLDTYTLFMEQAYNLLHDGGKLGYIVPSTWLTMFYFKNLREFFIYNTIFEKILLFRYQVFADVTAETSILVCSKQKSSNEQIDICFYNESHEIESKPYKTMYHDSWKQSHELGFNVLFDIDKLSIINKIIDDTLLLENCCIVSSGLVPYEVGKGTPKQSREDLKNRIYDANYQVDNTYLNYIVGGSISKYVISPSVTNWLKFGDNLAAPRKSFDFFQKKIMVRQTSDKIIGSIDTIGYISLKSVHNIVITDDVLTYETLLCILNSKLIDFYYKFLVPEEGRTFAEVKAVNLKRLPIKKIDEKFNQKPFIEKADLMLNLNKSFQTKKEKFLKRLESNFEIEKLSKKLEAFYELDFKTFLKELKKKKVTLTLKEQDEWEEYFESYQKELLEIKAEIDKMDGEIDEMVYELYGLSGEEVAVVES
jgi:type I restriction-modification system DNA methylase subunit